MSFVGELLEPLPVGLPRPAQLGAPVRQHHLGRPQLGDLDGGLERRVAPADHQDAAPLVLLGVGEPVGHLLQILARHAHLPGRSPATDGEDDLAGLDDPLRRVHGEGPVLSGDAGDLDPFLDLHVGLLEGLAPRLEELLLGDDVLADLAKTRDRCRLGHHHLAARVVEHGAAPGPLLEDPVAAPGLLEGAGRGQPGRASPHDDHVDPIASASTGARALGEDRVDPGGGLEPLPDRVSQEAHCPQLADDVHAGLARLEVLVDLGEVHASLGGPHHQLDRLDRALRGAPPVPDAVVGVDQARRPLHDAEDVPLRAGLQAGERADADVGVDDGMERPRDMEVRLGLLLDDPGVARLAAAPLHHVPDGKGNGHQDGESSDGARHRIHA